MLGYISRITTKTAMVNWIIVLPLFACSCSLSIEFQFGFCLCFGTYGESVSPLWANHSSCQIDFRDVAVHNLELALTRDQVFYLLLPGFLSVLDVLSETLNLILVRVDYFRGVADQTVVFRAFSAVRRTLLY